MRKFYKHPSKEDEVKINRDGTLSLFILALVYGFTIFLFVDFVSSVKVSLFFFNLLFLLFLEFLLLGFVFKFGGRSMIRLKNRAINRKIAFFVAIEILIILVYNIFLVHYLNPWWFFSAVIIVIILFIILIIFSSEDFDMQLEKQKQDDMAIRQLYVDVFSDIMQTFNSAEVQDNTTFEVHAKIQKKLESLYRLANKLPFDKLESKPDVIEGIVCRAKYIEDSLASIKNVINKEEGDKIVIDVEQDINKELIHIEYIISQL